MHIDVVAGVLYTAYSSEVYFQYHPLVPWRKIRAIVLQRLSVRFVHAEWFCYESDVFVEMRLVFISQFSWCWISHYYLLNGLAYVFKVLKSSSADYILIVLWRHFYKVIDHKLFIECISRTSVIKLNKITFHFDASILCVF